MGFALVQMTFDDERKIFAESYRDQIGKYGSTSLSKTESRLQCWVHDADRNASLMSLKAWDPRTPRLHYVLALADDMAVIALDKEREIDLQATLVFLSAGLQGREAEVQQLFVEAFTAGARYFTSGFSDFGPLQITFSA